MSKKQKFPQGLSCFAKGFMIFNKEDGLMWIHIGDGKWEKTDKEFTAFQLSGDLGAYRKSIEFQSYIRRLIMAITNIGTPL